MNADAQALCEQGSAMFCEELEALDSDAQRRQLGRFFKELSSSVRSLGDHAVSAILSEAQMRMGTESAQVSSELPLEAALKSVAG